MADDEAVQEALSDALRTFAVEMEQYIQAAGGAVALHRTDLNALSHAMDATRAGVRLTPGELATRMSLSPSATTAMLDRLEAAGHVVRSRDGDDRRVVTVTMTDHAQQTSYAIFLPLDQAFAGVMADYTAGELRTIEGFMADMAEAMADYRADLESNAPGALP